MSEVSTRHATATGRDTGPETERDAADARALVVVAAAGVLLLAGVAPFQLVPFQVFQLTMVLVYAVALLGLNLLVGHAGQISLGHGAFFAVGAYGAAIMLDRWDAVPGDAADRRRRGVPARARARRARQCGCAGSTWPWSPWPSRSSWCRCSSGSRR